ncbi:hypothetical protein [Mycobacterium lentiflavum]
MTAPNDPGTSEPPAESRTRIIRRAPSGPMPSIPDNPTTHLPRPAAPDQGATRAAARSGLPDRPIDEPTPRTVAAAAAVSIVSGWATSVVATDLIAGWWRTDRLFCIAIAFLALVFATATITGVIMLLQRRALGRYLVITGAVVAVLTYGGVFIAGARVAWIVHAFPVLPIASVLLAVHPHTKRWLQG